MTEATITVEDTNSQTPGEVIKIVHIAGQLDESNVDEKIQEIYKVVEANPKGLNLLFDMTQLEYMNSKSIGYLTDLYGKISESGGQVAIAGAQPNIVDILQVVGLTQLIKTFSTIDEAKSYLASTTAAQDLAGSGNATPQPQQPIQANPAPAVAQNQPVAQPVQPQAAEQSPVQPQQQAPPNQPTGQPQQNPPQTPPPAQ